MQATTTRAAIVRFYLKATYSYAIPFVLLLLGFVESLFWTLSLVSFLPLGIVGLFYTKRGMNLSVSSGDREKKDVGYANLILGTIVIIIGVFNWALAYLMVN